MFDIDINKVAEQLLYDPSQPMIFSSGVFLWLFLGFMLIYMLLERKLTARLLFVTAFSYYFYYKSSGIFFFLLAVVTVSDFLLAKAIYKAQKPSDSAAEYRKNSKGRFFLVLSLVIDLALLSYFKYTNFFGEIFASLTGGHFTALDIFLPVGISFFTFQSLSYTIDVYRGNIKPLHSLLDYAFYVSFFPQLVAGPIVRASDFIPQIRKPLSITPEMFGAGVFFVVGGLFKKAIISDYISINFVERVFDQPTLYSGFENLMAVYGYALQIYCDFSGYSDMAIGIALLLGFKFPMNFNAPYKSRSITEFWRRWHISLSSWLKDYLYISMGGNRKGKIRQYMNLVITMLLGGLWHGASLKFVLWGGIHGVLLVVDKVWKNLFPRLSPVRSRKDKLGKPSILVSAIGWIVTFHLVCLAWIFFRCDSIDEAMAMLTQIATRFQPQIIVQWFEGYWFVATLMALGFVLHFIPQRASEWTKSLVTRIPFVLQALLIVVVIYIVIQIKSSDVQPFIYFQF